MKSIYKALALAAIAVTALVSCQKDSEKTDEPEDVANSLVTPSGEQTISKVLICKNDYLSIRYAEVQVYAKDESLYVIGIPDDFWGKTAGLNAQGEVSSNWSYFWDCSGSDYGLYPASDKVGPGNSVFFSFDEKKMTIKLEVDLKAVGDIVYKIKYVGPVALTEDCYD